MSLLMDALRRAEEAKRKARQSGEGTEVAREASTTGDEVNPDPGPEVKREQDGGPTVACEAEALELSRDPLDGSPSECSQNGVVTTSAVTASTTAAHGAVQEDLPAADQAFELKLVQDFPSAGESARPNTQRAAQSIFDAKVPPLRNARTWLWFGGVPLVLVVLATGAYYLGLDMTSGAGLVSRPKDSFPAVSATIARSEVAALVSAGTPGRPPDAPPVEVAAELPSESFAASQLQLKGSRRSAHSGARKIPTPGDTPRERSAVRPAHTSSTATPAASHSALGDMVTAGDIKIARRGAPVRLSPELTQAFAAFKSGNHASARIAYRRVLQRDANNVNALLGLAAIATQNGLTESATELYARVIRLDPNNSVAGAALLSMQKNLDPVTGETRLKRLLEREPDAAHLHFTLGNLYATQSRWAQAQRAYFNAFRANSDNADFAYNLAVSLDQLAQVSAALQYYRRALTLGDGKPVGFDPGAVLERVRTLSGAGATG